jgi:hypothetical protein
MMRAAVHNWLSLAMAVLGGIVACCLALLSGVMAMRKGGAATLYALSITLSLALLFTAFQFRWIFAW